MFRAWRTVGAACARSLIVMPAGVACYLGRHVIIGGMIGMIGPNHPTNWLIILVGGMMDIYCLGAKTWLICGPKEAKLSNIPFWEPLRGPQKGVLDSFGFLWAANQPGFSPQALNIHHSTYLADKSICEMIWPYHPNHPT